MARKITKLKIAVAMSGGVDSSVAAKLLAEQGHQVIGVFLHFWKNKNQPGDSEALIDARRVANKIHIPFYEMNFAKLFKKQVVDNFLDEYKHGRTPNPCVRCNKLVKLGNLIKQAKKLGFDYVATGHYAKKIGNKLYKARDGKKDQSYFLYTLNQAELMHLLFPLGDYTKQQVRLMAKNYNLPVAEKKESQEICFIPERSHNEFLRCNLKLKPGAIKLLTSQPPFKRGAKGVIGRHQGLPLYTIGQRKGIEIGGTGPYYAAKMDYKKNILYVVSDGNDKNIFSNKLTAKNVNWINGLPPKNLKCQAVIRYRHKSVNCRIKQIDKTKFNVVFDEPQRAITPGQSVVFYKGSEVLGGGVIE